MCDPLPLDGQPMMLSKRVELRTSDNLTPTFRFRLHQVRAQSTIQCSGDSSRSLLELPSHIIGTVKGVSNWRKQGDGVDQELVLRVQFCLKSPDTSRVSDQELPAPNVTRQTSGISITLCSFQALQGTKIRLLGYPRSLPRLDPTWRRYPRL